MADIGGAGRTGTTVYRSFMIGKRILHQRRLLSDIRFRALVEALHPGLKRDDPVPSHISQAAKLLCDELDYIQVPEERTRGIIRGLSRKTRERVTHGIRFPEYRNGMHTTFFRRLGLWSLKAAESEKGQEALLLAGIPPAPEREVLFADRFWVALYGLLMDSRGPSDEEEALRVEIANEILHGMSDQTRMDRYRLLQDLVNSTAGSLITTATSYFGFQQSPGDALSLGGATLVAAVGVTTVRHLRAPGLTEKMQEARRQAKNWLLSLHAWMVEYVVWGDAAVRSGQYSGIDQIAYIARSLASQGAYVHTLPRDDVIREDIALLIENSERSEDGELTAALMRLQGALLWRGEHLGSALGNLLALVQNTPDLPEEVSPPIRVDCNIGPPQLPRQTTDPEGLEIRRGDQS